MEHIYRLTGTLSELQNILQSQFNMEEKAAKFSVCLLLLEQQQSINELNGEHTALWYLNKCEHFTTPIFKSRFSISFTDAGKDLLEHLILLFGEMLTDGDSSAFAAILNCLLIIYRSGTYIQKEECCVYYQALKWKATHASQEYFQAQDILPCDPEKICFYLDLVKTKKWNCTTYRNENCNATIASYSKILDELCERNVLKKYNEMYRFTK